MKQKINNLVETFGEPTIEVVSELFLEGTAGALIPGLTSVLGNIRTKRLERNLMVFIKSLQADIESLNLKYNEISEKSKEKFKEDFSEMIIDYIADERDEDKIKYITNGIKNLLDDSKNFDNTSLYFDTLKNLRNIDILILKKYDYKDQEYFFSNIHEIIEPLHVDFNEFKFIREKLSRNGLLESNFDTEQVEINEILLELSKYLKELEKGKKINLPNKIKNIKVKKNETIKLSKFGRSFIDFFTGDIL